LYLTSFYVISVQELLDQPIRRRWLPDEIAAVQRKFEMTERKLPGKAAISAVLDKECDLKRRSWTDVKTYIRNCRVTQLRKTNRRNLFLQ